MHMLYLIGTMLAIAAGCALLGCAPGPIGTLFGVSDPGTNPGVPNPGNVGADYLNLISGYAQGVPTLLGAEQQYKPGFVNTALGASNQALYGGQGAPGLLSQLTGTGGALTGFNTAANLGAGGGAVNQIGILGPAAAQAVGAVNPANTALINQLTNTASSQLAAGTQLDPATATRITQQVQGDWANRGLGASAPAQLDQAVQLASAGQNVLAQREQAAGQAAGVSAANLTFPALQLAGTQSQVPGQAFSLLGAGNQVGGGAGATVINPSSAYDTFNTAYNARAASQIAAAQNQAALDAY